MSTIKHKTPCLFLFDGAAEGVRRPALSMFTSALLRAISGADPNGSLVAELRGGLPQLSEFAAKISDVSSGLNRSGYTQTYDMRLYRLLLWDLSTALSDAPGAPTSNAILDVLRKRREECLTLSNVSENLRKAIDRALKRCPGYIGACELDAGNPILRRAFYDGLMHLALIQDGFLIQQRTIEGGEAFELEGAKKFKPNGLKWIDNSYSSPATEFRLEAKPLSERGALSVDRLNRKTHTTVEGRVFDALVRASWTDKKGQTYRFSSVQADSDLLEAVLPEGKFTGYLFDRNHPNGGPKAQFIIDVLGFDPEDWRYLAAQLYDGLLLSEPRGLSVEQWEGGLGARFNALVRVTSRTGKSGILRTGWTLRPGYLPHLVTAVPDRSEVGLVTPPTPPVLSPMVKGDDRWAKLFMMAHENGRSAHAAILPTPMILEDFGVIEEGECGSASVLVADARRGFARWLIKTGRGYHGHKGGAAIPCHLPPQSLERASAYANAFARVLALNGVLARVHSFYT